MKKKSKRNRLITSLLGAVILTAFCGSGMLYTPDNTISDQLFQRAGAVSEDIAVIGIDQYAIDQIGSYPWDRSVMAEIIDKLNENPEDRPAVIGVDVLYIGVGSSSESDDRLVEALGRYDNVVVAEDAVFNEELVADDVTGEFYMDSMAVTAFQKPFEALENVTDQGHINAMYDDDGILRHGLRNIQADGETVPLFAWKIYEKFAQSRGIDCSSSTYTDKDDIFYIPYTAMPGGFSEGYSVADVLEGNIPEGYLEGRAILIGPYAAGLMDDYPVSISHAEKMYGIEIQANMLNAFINDEYKSEAGDGIQLLILFIITFLSLLFLHNRKVLPSILFTVAVIAASTGAALLLYSAGEVVHTMWIPFCALVAFIFTVAENYVRTSMEKKRVQAAFGRYVDPGVIKELMREDSDSLGLGGKLTDIACLFVDIRGFTTMSEILTPQQVVEILNQYLTLTTRCIMQNHGTLDKFIGDCTMAIWNAPLPQEDYVYNACRAAMDMVEGSKEVCGRLQEQFGRTVSFGIGVHCGPAVVGNIGAEMRMDFTAIGDTVNTASRLEANAPGGIIYISRDVAEILGDRADVTSLGQSIKLKGKAENLEIFTLDGLH